MHATSSRLPPLVLYRRHRTDHTLRRKVVCSSFLFLSLCFFACIVVLPKQAHACFQPTWSTQKQQQHDTLFPTVTSSSSTNLAVAAASAACPESTTKLGRLASQLDETDDHYQLRVFVPPGVSSKQLQVDVDPTTRLVQVVVAKKWNDHDERQKHGTVKADAISLSIAVECFVEQWHVNESVHLPDLVMSYRDGVLKLSIPKKQVLALHPDTTTPHNQRQDATQDANSIPSSKTKLPPSSGPFIKGASPKPRRVRGVFPAMSIKNSALSASTGSAVVPAVESLTLPPPPPGNLATDQRIHAVAPVHSIRGGGTFEQQHVEVVAVKQPSSSHGLLDRRSFDPLVTTGPPPPLPVARANSDDLDKNLAPRVYERLSQVSPEEEEYWFHKM